MEIGDLHVLDVRENSTLVSTWNTYLCIERVNDSEYKLCIRGYEVLCTVNDYQKEIGLEDDDDFNITDHYPDIYNGKQVIDIEDGEYIVGGDLVETGNEEDDEEFIFTVDEIENVKNYLSNTHWDLDIIENMKEILIKDS